MRIENGNYVCNHCDNGYSSFGIVIEHMDKCLKNPSNKSCHSCNYFIPNKYTIGHCALLNVINDDTSLSELRNTLKNKISSGPCEYHFASIIREEVEKKE